MIGLYVVEKQADMIKSKQKKVIIKERYYRSILGKDMALITKKKGRGYSYGLIRLKKPKPIRIAEFKKLAKFHQISDEERNRWWPKAQKLYAYDIESFFAFRKPQLVDLSKDCDTIQDDVNIVGMDDHTIQIEKFNAETLNRKRLMDNFRQACNWYAMFRNGAKLKFTEEQLMTLGKKLMAEMLKRKVKFNRNSMKKTSIEFVERLSKDLNLKDFYMTINPGTVSERGSEIMLDDFLDKWDSMELFKGGITLVGSLANHGRTTGDIDIVIKAEPDTDMFNLIKWRITRAYPEYEGRLHFSPYGKWAGPFTSHIELAHITAVKDTELKLHEMSSGASGDMGVKVEGWDKDVALSKEEDEIKIMRPFLMLKPMAGRRKEEHYTVDSVIDVVKDKWGFPS